MEAPTQLETLPKSGLSAQRYWVVQAVTGAGAPAKVVLALACLALLLFGVLGVARSGDAGMDAYVLWAAGAAWWRGMNPYDPAQLAQVEVPGLEPGAFAYPPHIAPLCMALGALPFQLARVLFILTNVGCAVAVAEYSGRLLNAAGERLQGAWLLCITLAIPFTLHTIFMGQTSLVALTGAVAATWYASQKKPVTAGLLLALSSVKPQISLLVVLWFLLRRDLRVLGVLAATGLVAVAIPALIVGPSALIQSWLEGMRHYSSVPFNQLGFQHMFGLPSFLLALGLKVPGIEALALVALGAAWYWRKQLSELETLGALLAVAMLCLRAHDYDLVALLPFIFAFAGLTRNEPRWRWFGLGLLAILFFPQRFLRPLDIKLLEQFRVPVVLAALVAAGTFKARHLSKAQVEPSA